PTARTRREHAEGKPETARRRLPHRTAARRADPAHLGRHRRGAVHAAADRRSGDARQYRRPVPRHGHGDRASRCLAPRRNAPRPGRDGKAMTSRCAALCAGLLAFLAAGCATLDAPFAAHLSSGVPQLRGCAEWYRSLDERVAAAGTRDAQDARVPGFPYLRVSRLLAALRPAALSDDGLLRALTDRMLALDVEARRYEIMNLPAGTADTRQALLRTRECGTLLRDVDLAAPESRAALLQRAEVPDDYVLANRILGLYWLTRIAFAQGVRREEELARARFRRAPSEGASALRSVRYAPEPGAQLTRPQAALVLEHAAGNPLRIPEPSEENLNALLAAYAPSFEVDVRGDYDRFGALRWLRDADSPSVDGSQLAVYAHAAWTRYEDRVLLQLVYTLWFPRRPPQHAGDPLAGTLDGITWRVTLAPDGEPLIYDAIHA